MNKFLKLLNERPILCAEGYVFELERRGYLQAGSFVPECVLTHPEVVEQLHKDFVHAGSDVVIALTYYAHKVKMQSIGKEEYYKDINTKALQIAKKVADETGTLFAGDICNTNIWYNGAEKDPNFVNEISKMFDDQVKWAKDAGCDYVIAETFSYLEEARLAVKSIKKHQLPVVITLTFHKENETRDNWEIFKAFQELVNEGADVVGINCHRGPETMLPLLEKIKDIDIPIAALPVPYRTTKDEPTFMSLTDPNLPLCTVNHRPFPVALDPKTCSRYEITEFTQNALKLGIRYLGLCCGAGPHHIRSMAEAMGKNPPASKYSPNMELHFAFGSDKNTTKENRDYTKNL